MNQSLKQLEGRRVRIVNFDLTHAVCSNRIHRVEEVKSVGESYIYRLRVSRTGEKPSKREEYDIYLYESAVERLVNGEEIRDAFVGIVRPLPR